MVRARQPDFPADAAPAHAGSAQAREPLRPDIDAALVRRLIASQFPHWADLPIGEIEPGGWDNRSFRLGETMVARLPSAECYSRQIEKEQHWLPILAPELPLPIPTPLAMGAPGEGFPWHWSIRGWLEGETALLRRLRDPRAFARSVGGFLAALHRIDAALGPAPGAHNFHRGGPLELYDRETRDAAAKLGDSIDADKALCLWDAALGSQWRRPPVWVHGDLSPGNLLLRNGRLAAVIDFGCCGVGDPACDLALAWTFLGPDGRAELRAVLPLDAETWTRGRGWALWKTLISIAGARSPGESDQARSTLAHLLAD